MITVTGTIYFEEILKVGLCDLHAVCVSMCPLIKFWIPEPIFMTLDIYWHKHIFAKRKQLGIAFTKMYWLLGRKSNHSTSNKLLIYKIILKLIWTYGIQLWGTASTSNIEIIERFQSKALRMIVDAPSYVPNTVIRRNLQIPKVKEEIRRYSSQYSARLSSNRNDLILNLIELPDNRRLRRHPSNDL
jgi:hypothetical protein